jgi:hypothetical protein
MNIVKCWKYYCYLSWQIQVWPPIFHCSFLPPNIDATLLCPPNFHGSASILYKPLYRPLFFSNVLDLILIGTNKGYHSCSPCHHFHTSLPPPLHERHATLHTTVNEKVIFLENVKMLGDTIETSWDVVFRSFKMLKGLLRFVNLQIQEKKFRHL